MIFVPSKIYIDNSNIHGLGVFAKEKILRGEVIEECSIITLPITKGNSSSLLIDYRFNFPCGSDWNEQVIPLGYGCIYNHSNEPNAYWYSNVEKRTFVFVALCDINIGDEIFTYYGDVNYWNDGRKHTNLK